MISNFPFGDRQVLSIGDLSLTLNRNNFNGKGDNALGYDRTKIISQQITISNSLDGSAILEGNFFTPKHQFNWDIWLYRENMLLLYAIWKEQQRRARTQQAGIGVRLLDERQIFLGFSPRDRAKIGDIVNNPVAPTGFIFFWAQFDIFLEISEDFFRWFLTSSDHLFNVKLKAREISIVPPTEDLP